MPLTWLADSLRAATPWIQTDLSKLEGNSLEIAWFLPAEQHIFEWLALNALLVCMVAFDAGRWTVAVPASAPVVLSGSHWVYSLLDAVICVSAILTLVATVIFKHLTDRVPFLLQPCHILNVLMLYLAFVRAPKSGRSTTTTTTTTTTSTTTTTTTSKLAALDWPSIVFNIYLHSMYGAWLGLLLPDTRDLKLPFEVASFFTQHVTLCFAPMYFIARGRFNIYHPRILYCWAWKFLYHVDILLPVGIVTASNLNYMMVPAKPLLVAGRVYRPIMGILCIILTVAMRYGITQACVRLFVRSPPRNKID